MVTTAPESAARPRGYRPFHYLMIMVVVAAVATAAAGIATGIIKRTGPEAGVSTVRRIADNASVAGASSKLTRRKKDIKQKNGLAIAKGIDFTFKTTGLTPGDVVMLRAEIFNNPKACGHPANGGRCGAADLTNPSADASVVVVEGVLQRGAAGNFRGLLTPGDASRAVSGHGLTNLDGAEIHLILADKGPAVQGLYSAMVSTLNGGCTNAPAGTGTPGPNTCSDIQAALHKGS